MKKLFALTALIFITSFMFSQQQLDSETASWHYVMPGKLVCQPQNTSYGYVTLDESRTLSAFTADGTKLWEQNTERGSNTYLSVLNNDFICLITHSGQKMQLLNPTGSEIWSILPDTPITDKAYAGRDGRFFVRNFQTISCYGLNGIKKWEIETEEQKNLPIFELNDGSLLVFLEENPDKNQSYNSKALRISPFGQIISTVVFDGIIDSAADCESGLLYSLTDGTVALLYVQNNKTINKWKINSKDFLKISFAVSTDSNEAVFTGEKIQENQRILSVNQINLQNGFVKKSFDVPNFSTPIFTNLTSSGILMTNEIKAVYYNFSGIELWNGFFPTYKKKIVSYEFLYNSKDYLLIFDSQWNARAYKVTQSTKQRIIKKLEPKKIKYEAFYTVDATLFDNEMMSEIDADISADENIKILTEGNYGAKEKFLMEKLLSGCKAYEEILFTKNSRANKDHTVFEKDNAGLEKMIAQMSLFGTDTFTSFIAYVINYETNRTNLNAALISIRENGYDPEGKILSSLYLLAKRTNKNDSTVSMEVCDAVYSICKFMGKPAFNKQGKEIITTFLYPQFNLKSKEYARETFKKISSLDL